MPEPKSTTDNICRNPHISYVAFDPEKGSGNIIASGDNVGDVIDSARNKGVDIPAIIFVPQEGVTYIY